MSVYRISVESAVLGADVGRVDLARRVSEARGLVVGVLSDRSAGAERIPLDAVQALARVNIVLADIEDGLGDVEPVSWSLPYTVLFKDLGYMSKESSDG
jgi:hypothetical protein